MNHAFYFIGGVAVATSMFLVQSIDEGQPTAPRAPVHDNALGAADGVAQDATSAAIDALAAWPAAAGR